MKRLYVVAAPLLALGVFVAGAAELKNGAEFSMEDLPGELTVHLKRGGAVRFLVEENGTTGYGWTASFASNECTVAVEHRGADASTGLCGAPGKAAFTITKNAAVQSPSLVEFAYVRSWEKGVAPAKKTRLVLYTVPGEAVDFRYPASRTLNMLKAECANRGIELVDWHVHIRGGLTPEMAAERERACGIRQSAMENHGREWEIFDNDRLAAFADAAKKTKVNGHALPVGIQVNDRDWFRQIDAKTRAKFDYVLADTMIMGKLPNGRDKRLWLVKDLAEIGDPEKWMDEYVAMNLQILGEPISILANPGYLPAPLDAMHDKLWTDERMKKVIAAAVERGIAIEIQAESPYPSVRFLKMAKQMGAKFSFGTNNYDAAPKDLSRWLEAIVWLDLHGSDIWTPTANVDDAGLRHWGTLAIRTADEIVASGRSSGLETHALVKHVARLRFASDPEADRRLRENTMQNIVSFFDADVHPVRVSKHDVGGRELTVAQFETRATDAYAVWFSETRPEANRAHASVDLSGIVRGDAWVNLTSGKIMHLDRVSAVPVGDSPVLIARGFVLPRRTVWSEMSPAEIVDAIYCPQQGLRPSWINGVNIKMDVSKEPWAGMKTADFLPCFDCYGQFKWREWPGKTHSDDELRAAAVEEEKDLAAHPGPTGWTKYGGWAAGPKFKATGRFYTKKVDGKWWLVDPEGCLFWSWGPVRVTPSSAMTPLNGNPRNTLVGGAFPDRDCLFADLPKKGAALAAFYDTYDDLLLPFYLKRGETRRYDFSAANLYRKDGEQWFAKFADRSHRRLRSWGCNTIANSSDLKICLMDRTPYAERIECSSRVIAGSHGQWGKFRDPFDPSFAASVRKSLEAHGREAHDPWCIGFFVDNEINWGRTDCDLARWTLWSPDDQPAKVEFVRRLAAKGINWRKGAVPDAELRDFTSVLIEEYFRRTRAAVKAFDRELLYLGCRFAGRAPDWVSVPCAKYCDVVSYNEYALVLAPWKIPGNVDAPMMIGEFHFGAHDRGLFGSGLCNMGSQEGRAAQMKKYVVSALENPQVVGVHWHQYADQATSGRFDGEHFQVGWTDVCDRPYAETRAVLRDLGSSLYESRARTGVCPPDRHARR